MTEVHTFVPSAFAESRWADPGHSRVAGLLLDPGGELGDLVVDAAALGEQLADLLVGVHDGGVVAATELLPDLGQGQLGELPAQVHGDLPAGDQDPAAAGATEVVDGQSEVGGGLGDDQRRSDLR